MSFSMNRTTRLLLVLSASAVSAACAPPSEVAQLGVYSRESPPPDEQSREDAGASADAASAPGVQIAAPAAVTPTPAQVPASVDPSAPPSCLQQGCIATVPQVIDAVGGTSCFRISAHTAGDRDQPFSVQPGVVTTFRSTMRAPFAGQMHYLRSIASKYDRAVVLHHMKLYQHNGVLPEGVDNSPVTPTGLRLLRSWAPGEDDMFFDPSVGIPLRGDTFFTIEVHYVASRLEDAVSDKSGFELCTTSARPTYEVSFARLGSESIAGSSAAGTCTVRGTKPIHLLGVQTQMNRAGKLSTLVISRTGAPGGLPPLYQAPFEYELMSLQQLRSVQAQPGEKLLSSCEYTRSVQAGEERCELYVLHWPAGSLSSPGSDPDVCLE